MFNKKQFPELILILFVGISLGFFINHFNYASSPATAENLQFDEQEAVVRAIEKVSPSVVNIVIYEVRNVLSLDLSTGEQTIEKETNKLGSGTGFIISADGYIITNKHVINVDNNKKVEYKVITMTGDEYDAQFVSKDPANDLAVLRIFENNLPVAEIGNSDNLEIGATVVAIGNALGRYQNTATKGIVSGLNRSLSATAYTGETSYLENIIQTDAQINIGNSGGPLVDLNGRVMGVNVAKDDYGTAIGFAIPINDAREAIRTVIESGRIIRPMLGVQYITVTPELAKEHNLSRNDGAWVLPEEEAGMKSVIADGPAEKAGIMEGDIVFEVNAIKINEKNTLASVVQKYRVGERIGLKIQRGEKVLIKVVVLEERKY